MIPHFVLASGWIPFAIFFVLALTFSTLYILYFRSVSSFERSTSATVTAVSALTLTLVTSALVPVDVFLVSFMKFSNGTYKPWAQDPDVRAEMQTAVLDTYYVFYALITATAFFALPMVFFYHLVSQNDDTDRFQDDMGVSTEEIEPCGRKLWRASKYTAILVIVFVGLVVAGYFIPAGNDVPPSHNGTLMQYEYEFQDFNRQKSENILVFLLNVLNMVGMFFLVIYTGYGMSSLPVSMIKGQRSVFTELTAVDEEIAGLEEQIKAIEERNAGTASTPAYETAQIDRLQQRQRLMQRTRRDLDQSGRSFLNRVVCVCRPFQFVFGIFFSLCGLLIFVSLLLTSVDKAIYSLGPKHGFVLVNSSLPNPVDMLLVYSQEVFPLDYVIYCGMLLFFLLTSIDGLRSLGIKFCCVSVYKIRPSKTKPQALLLMCFCLIFIVLALNVVMFSVVPDYTTYGSQSYVANVTVGNMTKQVVKRCDDVEKQETGCDMSRIAYLLLAYHSHVFFFGDVYFFLIWAFMIFVVVGTMVSVYRSRSTVLVEADEEDLLDDMDEESSNPFSRRYQTN